MNFLFINMGIEFGLAIMAYIIEKDKKIDVEKLYKYSELLSELKKIWHGKPFRYIKNSQELYTLILISIMEKPQIILHNLKEFMEEYCETNHEYQINHRGQTITIYTRDELNIPYFAAQYHFSGEMTLPDEYTIHDLYFMLIILKDSFTQEALPEIIGKRSAMLDFFGIIFGDI